MQKVLATERNMEVKNILDDYENNSMDDLDTLDVTRRILEARSNSLERIESLNDFGIKKMGVFKGRKLMLDGRPYKWMSLVENNEMKCR